MKILFDANTPAPLARFLRGHEVVRADELGWQGLEPPEPQVGSCHPVLESLADPAANRPRIATAVDFVQTGQIVSVDVAML